MGRPSRLPRGQASARASGTRSTHLDPRAPREHDTQNHRSTPADGGCSAHSPVAKTGDDSGWRDTLADLRTLRACGRGSGTGHSPGGTGRGAGTSE